MLPWGSSRKLFHKCPFFFHLLRIGIHERLPLVFTIYFHISNLPFLFDRDFIGLQSVSNKLAEQILPIPPKFIFSASLIRAKDNHVCGSACWAHRLGVLFGGENVAKDFFLIIDQEIFRDVPVGYILLIPPPYSENQPTMLFINLCNAYDSHLAKPLKTKKVYPRITIHPTGSDLNRPCSSPEHKPTQTTSESSCLPPNYLALPTTPK